MNKLLFKVLIILIIINTALIYADEMLRKTIPDTFRS